MPDTSNSAKLTKLNSINDYESSPSAFTFSCVATRGRHDPADCSRHRLHLGGIRFRVASRRGRRPHRSDHTSTRASRRVGRAFACLCLRRLCHRRAVQRHSQLYAIDEDPPYHFDQPCLPHGRMRRFGFHRRANYIQGFSVLDNFHGFDSAALPRPRRRGHCAPGG